MRRTRPWASAAIRAWWVSRSLVDRGIVAAVRAYIAELLPDVLAGRIEPGRVLDRAIRLDEVPDGYRAMNERRAIKVMAPP